MSKLVDHNGYWEIKHNPISKVGVFPYYGRSISDDCEPDKIYHVFRSAETLSQSVPTWDNPPKPFINDHEMLGEGFSKIDDRPVQGVIHNPVFEDGVLYADISVYSESLKEKIEGGKKELSLGYFCKYRKEKGVYKGQAYDFVQEDMVGNHIALVDNGRCGSDVKVFDSKCTMDSLDITNSFEPKGSEENASNGIIETKETKDSEMADKREYIRKIMAIAGKPDSDFEGGEKEKIETIAKLLEGSEYSKSEDEEEKEEEKKALDKKRAAKDKCGKDEDPEEEKETKDCSRRAKDEDDEEKKSEDEDDDENKETEDEDIQASDVMAFLKMILAEIRSLNGKKTTDEDDEEKAEDEDDDEKKSEDEDDDEKKDSEDEDEEKEEKKSEDSAIVMTFAKDGRDTPTSMMDDPGLRKYLGL